MVGLFSAMSAGMTYEAMNNAGAMHTRVCDETICIGPADARRSYLVLADHMRRWIIDEAARQLRKLIISGHPFRCSWPRR